MQQLLNCHAATVASLDAGGSVLPFCRDAYVVWVALYLLIRYSPLVVGGHFAGLSSAVAHAVF